MKKTRFAKMSGVWSLASVFAVSCASLSCVPGGGKNNPDSISITQNPVKTDYVEAEGWSNDYFSENFDPDRTSFYDKFSGDTLDTGKWLYQNGTGSQFGLSGWGNREAQFYKSENVSVRDGVLRIELRKERAGYGADARQYTSGKLVTYESESGAETFSQKIRQVRSEDKTDSGA